MKRYEIIISYGANLDIEDVCIFISDVYFAKLTAKKYYNGIINTINSLSYCAESIAVSSSKLVSSYGINARRINYKKMAIILHYSQ